VIVLIGALGPVVSFGIPVLSALFQILYLLGILGLTISIFFYSLHLYMFNYRILAIFTLSLALVFFILSCSFLSYLTILTFFITGFLGVLLGIVGFLLLFAMSFGILYAGDYLRTEILEVEHLPVFLKDLPHPYMAFVTSLLIILFITVNAFFFNGFIIETGNSDQIQADIPILEAATDFISGPPSPALSQQQAVPLQDWSSTISTFEDGYQKCALYSAGASAMTSMSNEQDRNNTCKGINSGLTELELSRRLLAEYNANTSNNILSQHLGAGLLLSTVGKISTTCQDLYIQCIQGDQALQSGNSNGFQQVSQIVKDDLSEMKLDHATASVLIGSSDSQ
jgi:hypothetical protein